MPCRFVEVCTWYLFVSLCLAGLLFQWNILHIVGGEPASSTILSKYVPHLRSNKAKPNNVHVKVGPPVHNYEHEAGSYGDGFT
jgi:hypothetical protein